MGSFTQLTYHIVFATKYRYPSIVAEIRERLYEYIGGTIRAKQGHLVDIGAWRTMFTFSRNSPQPSPSLMLYVISRPIRLVG